MRRTLLAALLAAAAMTAPLAPAGGQPRSPAGLHEAVTRDLPELMTLYRDLHAHPELSMQETRSAGLMAAEARRLGFTVTEQVGVTGVLAVRENGPGPA